MKYKLMGDGINTRTLVQTDEQGNVEIFFLLTPELLNYLQEIKEKIDHLEKIVTGSK